MRFVILSQVPVLINVYFHINQYPITSDGCKLESFITYPEKNLRIFQ